MYAHIVYEHELIVIQLRCKSLSWEFFILRFYRRIIQYNTYLLTSQLSHKMFFFGNYCLLYTVCRLPLQHLYLQRTNTAENILTIWNGNLSM